MADRIKVSIVSYVNSFPFIFGLKNHEVYNRVDLQLDTPADCAKKLLNGQVDLGLVPIAIIPELDHAHVVSDYCIGANGPVQTVCLFSQVPLDEVESVLLDYQSRTSVQLVQYLAENKWKIRPKWIRADSDFIQHIGGKTAGVVIGDRAFELKKRFPVVIDLSEEWYLRTGLPFVFACWVSNQKLENEFVNQFESALKLGLANRKEAIEEMIAADSQELVQYVENVISYDLDEKKQLAMKLFLDWLSKSA